MPTGRIKYYNPDKGFGFIAQDSGEADVFIHVSAINWVYDELGAGQQVKYDVIEGKRGLVAQDVEVLLTPLERKRLSQGKVIIPRDLPRSSSRVRSEKSDEKPSVSPQRWTQPTVAVSPDSQESKQSAESQPSDPGVEGVSAQMTAADVIKQKPVEPVASARSEASPKRSERPTFGNLYIQKQIRLQTPMFFGLYNHVQLPVTISEFTKYTFTLQGEGEKQEVPKTDVKYCYKTEDAEKIQSLMRYDEEIQAQKLKPIASRKERYEVDTQEIWQARKERYPIEVIMHEGEIFRGMVDWVSSYEIKMVLENGSKIVVFRHATCDFKAFPAEKQMNHRHHTRPDTDETTDGETT